MDSLLAPAHCLGLLVNFSQMRQNFDVKPLVWYFGQGDFSSSTKSENERLSLKPFDSDFGSQNNLSISQPSSEQFS